MKAQLNHGEYLPWVKDNCAFSRDRAHKYTMVYQAKCRARETFEKCQSIREVLEIGKAPKSTPKANIKFTTDDATHAKKLNALAVGGSTEGERENAQVKLDAFAGNFGMTSDEVLGESDKVQPEGFVKGSHESELHRLSSALESRPSAWLVQLLLKAVATADDPALWKELMKGSGL